ncbi:GTP binding protein, putative [Eimeria maxima]|uniref:GTP binding protein, putative n=1 Tax=Eimeria maxima TaxID=5804 RepID=U6M593_EIMMA|nr:GTP binding protein, putative [Eimeria maxima]CDJ59407.1 GTP binding protein, putative [Eimeria maxima]
MEAESLKEGALIGDCRFLSNACLCSNKSLNPLLQQQERQHCQHHQQEQQQDQQQHKNQQQPLHAKIWCVYVLRMFGVYRPRNTLKMGMVGLPNVVPDDRFRWLCGHFKPKSEVSATLSIFDIAGLVPGAHKGEGLGNAFLSHIQAVDGIFHVVRAFADEEVVHSEGEVDPVKDLATIASELRLKDLERAQRLLEDLQKSSRQQKAADKAKKLQEEVLQSVIKMLEEGKWVQQGNWKAAEVEVLNEHQFLTAKTVVYLVNMSEKDFIRQKNKWLAKIHAWVQENVPGPIIPYSAVFENKLAELPDDEARENYIKSSGASKSMLDKIIQTGYHALHLIHFFTCGEDEVKCWTIRQGKLYHCIGDEYSKTLLGYNTSVLKGVQVDPLLLCSGTKAPQAAGVIHTDFERGFICAEVYKYNDLVELGSENAVKAAGKYLQKGKDYVVEDGDIIFFKFNVTNSGKK